MLVGDRAAQLQKHRGLADARLAAQKHNAAQHDAAAQHTVQLGDPCQDAAFLLCCADFRKAFGCQRCNAFRTCCGGLPCRCCARLRRLGDHIFVHGVPAAAARAAAHPAGTCLSAVGTHVYRFQFWLFHEILLLFHIKHFLHCSILCPALQEKSKKPIFDTGHSGSRTA